MKQGGERWGLNLVTGSLEIEKLSVVAVFLNQFEVGARFCYLAVFNDIYFVGIADSGKTVGNHNNSLPFFKIMDLFEDFMFGLGVDSTGGLVKDENGGITKESTGKGNFLPLASGKIGSFFKLFGKNSFFGLREITDKGVGAGLSK